MTFENNEILDIKGMCAVFKQLRSFEKLESLNFRCNKNFNDEIVQALSDGIILKKELRVSFYLYLTTIFYRLLIWVRTTFPIMELRFLVKHLGHM